MKCLHILPMNKLSGAEKVALLICKNISKYEPIVICGGEDLKSVFEKNGIKSYAVTFSDLHIVKTLSYLKKIIDENNIKILHAHDNNASIKAYLVKSIYKLDVKVISHIHNCYPFLKSEGVNKKLDGFFRPKYDFNIACGKLIYNFYNDNTNYLKENKVKILSNAIDIEELEKIDTSKSEAVRKKFNIANDKIILGFIGRLDEQKGIIPFIKELNKYKNNFSDCKILLVGNGSQENEVKELIKEFELEDLFILTGFQNNTYDFYPIIDIFFLPSLYEGLPMVILEAMMFKKIVVSMDVGSINEVIINNKTGILVEKENYSRFIEALIDIKKSKSNMKILQENSFKHIYNEYNIKNYTNTLVNIYDDIAN